MASTGRNGGPGEQRVPVEIYDPRTGEVRPDTVRLGDVDASKAPIYRPLVDALGGKTPPTWRKPPVGELRIDPAFTRHYPEGVVGDFVAQWDRLGRRGDVQPILVMQRSNGSHWVSNDTV